MLWATFFATLFPLLQDFLLSTLAAILPETLLNTMTIANNGKLVNFITGITGVAAGNVATLNMPVNQRIHDMTFNCVAVNYSSNTQTVANVASGGTPATFAPVLSNRTLASVTIVTAGSGQTPGTYTGVVTDPGGTGAGASFTYVVAGGGTVVAAPIVTSAGLPTPINPVSMISSLRLLVNGVTMRDIPVQDIIKIAQANVDPSEYPSLGQLTLFFTEPWRKISRRVNYTSWDLNGQQTFQLQIGIAANVVNPGLTGIYTFDYFRNLARDASGKLSIPFLMPIAHHQFNFTLAGGRNDINTLPFNFPILRMWLQGSIPGNISQCEVFQDGNKPLEALVQPAAQLLQDYENWGFKFGRPDWLNTANAAPGTTYYPYYNPTQYYDAAYISDPEQRYSSALQVQNSLILRVFSDQPQNLTVIMETLPGNYAG